MARGFGSTFGNGATGDSIQTGYTTIPNNLMSFSLWFFLHGYGQGGFGQIITQSNVAGVNASLLTTLGSASLLFVVTFSVTSGVFSIPIAPAAVWKHLVITYDASSLSNVPLIYINGVAQTVTTVAPVGTLTTSVQPIYIGSNRGVNSYADAKFAEFSYWNGILLNGAEVSALAKGVIPLFVRPKSLSLYMPLNGAQAGEADWGPSRVASTVTGTKFQPHAPVSLWTPQNASLQFPFTPAPSVIGPSSYKRLYLPKLRTRASI